MILVAGVLEAVLQHQLRLALGQADGLLIEVGVARRVAQFLGEFDPVGELFDGPLPRVGNLVSLELLERPLLRLADRADADLDEALAGLDVVVTETYAVGEKLLHRTQDGIVELRIVAVEPLAEIVVALEFEACDLARPIEARGAVVALLRVGQVELGADRAVGDLGLREIRGGERGNRQREVESKAASSCGHWSSNSGEPYGIVAGFTARCAAAGQVSFQGLR